MRIIAGLTALWIALACAITAEAARPSRTAAELARQQIPKLNFDGITFDRVLRFYREMLDAKIEPDWEALGQAGVTRDSLVRMSATQTSFGTALDMTLAGLAGAAEPISWAVEGDVFRISTQRDILQSRRQRPAVSAPRGRPVPIEALVPRLDLQDVRLSDVVEFIRAISGANVFVNWNALAAVGVDRATSISVSAENITLWKALDLVLDTVNVGKGRLDSVYWVREDNVITITTGSDLDRELIVRVFDVADLLMVVPNFAAPRMSLSQGNSRGTGGRTGSGTSTGGGLFGDSYGQGNQSGRQGGEELSSAEQREQLRTDLLNVVTTSTGADLWEPLGRGTARIFGGKLIISQTRLGYKIMERTLARR